MNKEENRQATPRRYDTESPFAQIELAMNTERGSATVIPEELCTKFQVSEGNIGEGSPAR